MKLSYVYHYDEDEVERVLRKAENVVARCDLDPELFRTGFEKAVDMLSQKVATGVEGSQIIPAGMIGR